MKILAKILVLPGQPPRVEWSQATRQEKAEFCELEIRERLEYLANHCQVESEVEPWPGLKDRNKADLLRQSAMSQVKAAKFVEAILQFNSASRFAPATVIQSHTIPTPHLPL